MRIWLLFMIFLAHFVSSDLYGQRRDRFQEIREQMVRDNIREAGIKNERVLEAMRNTPRHEFVPRNQIARAYFDMALPIGEHQTISPPYIVAFMTEQLDPQPEDRVLEIGTGSGYQAAVLSPLVKEVYTIEIVEPLGKQAAKTLEKLDYDNVHTKIGDGFKGWPEKAPFDKIIVTCSPEKVPRPLVEQLKEGGRMVIPLGRRYQQTMYLFKKKDGKLEQEALQSTLFVPMTGTAEELRQVQPDPENPQLANGSFEEIRERDDKNLPVGWHYLRQAEVVDDKLSPNGERHLRFQNETPGRVAQAVQGFALDGRKVKQLAVTTRVKLEDVRAGRRPDQLAVLIVTFYDEDRGIIGDDWLGPWFGSFDWSKRQGILQVPPKTRMAIMQIGLMGGTGTASFDDIEVKAASKR